MNGQKYSCDVLGYILGKNTDIDTMRFFFFSTNTKLQQRKTNLQAEELNLIEVALARKKRDGVRFWEALLSDLAGKVVSNRALLSEALYHQPNRDYSYVDSTRFESFYSLNNEKLIALNSQVLLKNGAIRHLVLLDFKLKSDPRNHQLAQDCVSSLGLKGFLLDSGRSYHFIGLDLVTESGLIELLAKFLLFHPLSDMAWAAHQLIEKSASLRISGRNGKEPVVVRRIGLSE